uniref:ETAA1 activator of ATR kinase n=1 Tax=Lepisosteus oculatus TaxID=7918 RepID=W5NGH8_LEPOC
RTPRRCTRVNRNPVRCVESPSNDSEFHEDIIWDPSSPTPIVNGKGCNKSKMSGKAVEISDIVNRIAPKDDRPKASEAVLLDMWFGDGIPCTPEVVHSRSNFSFYLLKCSHRQNGVEELMKLAKQFDINMIQQDTEQRTEILNYKLEQDLSTENENSLGNTIPLFFSKPSSSDISAVQKGITGIVEEIRMEHGTQKFVDSKLEDEMNALFDGPTQHLSGRLSQSSVSHSQQLKVPTVTTRSVCEKAAGLGFVAPLDVGSVKTISSPESHVKITEESAMLVASNNDFNDDWANDDLLDDSFLLEVTQNPDLITSAEEGRRSSNHAGPSSEKNGVQNASSASATGLNSTVCGQSSISCFTTGFERINEKAKNRSTFTLEANPQFKVKETFSLDEARSMQQECILQDYKNKINESSLSEIGRRISVRPDKNIQKYQQSHSQKTPSALIPYIQHTTKPSSATKPCDRQVETNVKEKQALSFGFGSESKISEGDFDSLWEDGDDDLLYLACDDVEKLSTNRCAELGTSKLESRPGLGIDKGIHAGTKSSTQSGIMEYTKNKPTTAFKRSSSFPSSTGAPVSTLCSVSSSTTAAANVSQSLNNRKNCRNVNYSLTAFKPQDFSDMSERQNVFEQTRSTSVESKTGEGNQVKGAKYGSASCLQNLNNKSVTSSVRFPETSKQASFRRHQSDPAALNSKGELEDLKQEHTYRFYYFCFFLVFVNNQRTVKCSAEEIERKKQEAIARRRQRLQANQKNEAP